MIRDQRHMQGAEVLRGREQVRAFWHAFGRKEGFVDERTGLRVPGNPEDLTGSLTALAFVNTSRWVAMCPRCNGGIAAWPEHDDGCCLDCGAIVALVYPDDPTAGERVLSERPFQFRNWLPGETVDALVAENVTHGWPLPKGIA